jgi:transcription elongation factor GreA
MTFRKILSKEKQDTVNLGTIVSVESDGQINEFEIVNSAEANPSLGKISTECPVGKALLGHKVGDIVTVRSPIKTFYRILQIKYKKYK